MNTNLLDLNNDVLNIIGDYVKKDNNERIQDYDFLYKAGVSFIFGPGTVISKSAIDILNKLIKLYS